jgi:hypothetical protein
LQKFTRSADDIYSLRVEGESEPLGVTSEHPFFVRVYRARDSLLASDADGEWRETRQLQVGDEIKLANGNWAKILEVKFKGAGQVYNFTVAGNHNYFVGDLRLLTHNRCPELPGGNVPESDILDLGEKYLESGYKEVSPDRYVSQDGLRQFRLGKHELKNTPYHAHFEAYDHSYWNGGQLVENTVVRLIP